MPCILTVDDSAAMRQMVEVTLTSAGHEVHQAKDGREALEMVNARTHSPFDLVITDVNMPEMDGLQLVRELRGLPAYKHVPLLVLTTDATADRKNEGRQAGATGWLVKPFNPDKLLATVAKVLQVG